MNNLLGIAMIMSMVAVTSWNEDPLSCAKEKPVAAQAQCSQHSKMTEAANVRLVRLTNGLQLTSNQVAQVRAAFADCQTACSALTAKFEPLIKEIHAMKTAENPDFQAIKAKKAQLKALKAEHAAELAARRVDLIAKIKAVLTLEQAAKFEPIQSEIFGDDLALVAGVQ
jgi:Spy/CpxP family protein refolding chaperone